MSKLQAVVNKHLIFKMPVNVLTVVVFCRLSVSVQARGITVVIVIVASSVMAIFVWDLLLRYIKQYFLVISLS